MKTEMKNLFNKRQTETETDKNDIQPNTPNCHNRVE